KLRVGIERGQSRVVPRLDLAGEDLSEDLAGELQAALLCRQVVRRNDRSEDQRYVKDRSTLRRGELGVLHGSVRSAKVDGLRADLLHAAPGADALVGDLRPLGFLKLA